MQSFRCKISAGFHPSWGKPPPLLMRRGRRGALSRARDTGRIRAVGSRPPTPPTSISLNSVAGSCVSAPWQRGASHSRHSSLCHIQIFPVYRRTAHGFHTGSLKDWTKGLQEKRRGEAERRRGLTNWRGSGEGWGSDGARRLAEGIVVHS